MIFSIFVIAILPIERLLLISLLSYPSLMIIGPGNAWQLVISIFVPSSMNSFRVQVVIILVFLRFSDGPDFSLSSFRFLVVFYVIFIFG